MKKSRALVGKTVNKGDPAEAIILDAKQDFLNDAHIVLCFIPARREFVTWWMNADMQTFHGHYALNLKDAFNEFRLR
jgi:hypothetical protein